MANPLPLRIVLRNIFYQTQRYQMIPSSAQKAVNQLQQASKLRNGLVKTKLPSCVTGFVAMKQA